MPLTGVVQQEWRRAEKGQESTWFGTRVGLGDDVSGGVKGGQIIGATDEFGMHAIERKVPRSLTARDDSRRDRSRPHRTDLPPARPPRTPHRQRRGSSDRSLRVIVCHGLSRLC